MFQATRRRLALWYTTVTAVLLLFFTVGFYLYVRITLVERVDDTLSHVVEVVQRSLVIEPAEASPDGASYPIGGEPPLRVNVEASFRDNAATGDDDRIDLEWFSPTGELLWSTLSAPLEVPIHINPKGETVHISGDQLLRQVTERIQVGRQVLGYLRVSHPWFEVTKPTRRLLIDLSIGTALTVLAVAAIGWFLSGIAIAPVRNSYHQLKQFTADASHELRNPIAVIQTNVQVALADPNPDVQFQQYQLRVIERLIRRLGRLVDDLLFLARQDSGTSPPQVAPVEMDALLVEVLEEQQAIALDKDITLSLHLGDGPENGDQAVTPRSSLPQPDRTADEALTIWGDRDQLIRLFTNLVSNAIQYTPSGGEVGLEVGWVNAHHQPQLQIRVRDTGVGIPPEALPHLFDRFYRVDPARSRPNHMSAGTLTKSETAGSGLGLAIAQVIVENHQGFIRIDSKLDQGTTVTVTLPQLGEAST